MGLMGFGESWDGPSAPAPTTAAASVAPNAEIGDVVVGLRVDDGRSVLGLVVGRREVPAPYLGHRYDVVPAEVRPTAAGPVETYGGVVVIARGGEVIECGICRGLHATPARFLACVVARLRADVEQGAAARIVDGALVDEPAALTFVPAARAGAGNSGAR